MLTSIVISSTNRAFSPFMMHALPSVTKKETEAEGKGICQHHEANHTKQNHN